MTTLTDRAKIFRDSITAFIEERRSAKLKGDDSDGDAASKYDYVTWLADAARRVSQIQAVTHVLKATHPDARGSSLHVTPSNLPQHVEIGSHALANEFAEDVVGNAAALDVFKFLKVEVEGKRLLDWMHDVDPDLQAALSDDTETAKEWMQSFSSLVRQEASSASHVMAKQLYWLVGEEPAENGQYHLLQPLFSSSLAHVVHADIQRVRFGEDNKIARQARRDKLPYSEEYHDYRDLALRKLGGTKPQNISQLNSERGGMNYLLSSLPPKWTTNNPIKLLQVDSVLGAFRWFEDVPHLLKSLSEFLLSDPQRIKETREKREELEQLLGQQLALFGESIRFSQEPGWTRNSACCLPLCEKLWLDPERTELPLRELHESEDADFNSAYAQGDWPDQVASRFANWLNNHLHEKGLTAVGDVEHKHWAKQALLDVSWPASPRLGATGGAA